MRTLSTTAAPPSDANNVDDEHVALDIPLMGEVIIQKRWVINNAIVPTINRNGIDYIALHRSWRFHRDWLKILTGKKCPESGKKVKYQMAECSIVSDVLATLAANGNKPNRRARRVDADVVTIDVGDCSLSILNDMKIAMIEVNKDSLA